MKTLNRWARQLNPTTTFALRESSGPPKSFLEHLGGLTYDNELSTRQSPVR